jgi:hypothetical protein
VPCGHWLINRGKETRRMSKLLSPRLPERLVPAAD